MRTWVPYHCTSECEQFGLEGTYMLQMWCKHKWWGASSTTLGTIINFIDDTWTLRHVVVGLFGVVNTSSVALAKIVKSFLNVFWLTDKIMAYVKDEDANVNTLVVVHQSIVLVQVTQAWPPLCLSSIGHTMSKWCPYATNELRVCKVMKEMSLRNAHATL